MICVVFVMYFFQIIAIGLRVVSSSTEMAAMLVAFLLLARKAACRLQTCSLLALNLINYSVDLLLNHGKLLLVVGCNSATHDHQGNKGGEQANFSPFSCLEA